MRFSCTLRLSIVTAAVFLLVGGQFSFTSESQAKPEATKPPSGPYILQRGDSLEIKVFNVDELDTLVTIRPDGKISVLLLDDLEAAGKTTAQLDEILTSNYSAFYRDPKVTINVKSFVNQKIYVGGEVLQPGLQPLIGEMTALRAIMQAGGYKNTAKIDQTILLRNDGDGKPVSVKVNLKEIIEKGAQDIALAPFDVLILPKTKIAKMDTFMDQYIRQLIPISVSAGFTYLFNSRFTP